MSTRSFPVESSCNPSWAPNSNTQRDNYGYPHRREFDNWMSPYNRFDRFDDRFNNNMMMPFDNRFNNNMMMPFDNRFNNNMMMPFDNRFNNMMMPFDNRFNNNMMMPFNNMMAPFNRLFNDLDRSFSSELNLHPSRPSSRLEHYSLSHPIRTDADGNRWLNCYFDLRSFKPEEVNVTMDSKNRMLNVEASHEVKDKEHYVKRHYARKVYIPEEVKVDLSKLELKSNLNNDGMLCVEAPLPKLSLEEARNLSGGNKNVATCEPTVFKVNTKVV